MFVCVNLCMCVGRHSQVSLPSSALKLMIWGPENQQIWPPAGHNGEHDMPVDVFEDRSSFFSVNTSLPPHNRRIHYTNSRVTPVFMLLMRKCVSLCGHECVYAYRPMIILHVSTLWQSVKMTWNFYVPECKSCICSHDYGRFRNMWQSKAYYQESHNHTLNNLVSSNAFVRLHKAFSAQRSLSTIFCIISC